MPALAGSPPAAATQGIGVAEVRPLMGRVELVLEPSADARKVVDRVLGEQDVVIKSVAENYQNVPGIAGASILGNGRVSLILDVGALMQAVVRRGAGNFAAP